MDSQKIWGYFWMRLIEERRLQMCAIISFWVRFLGNVAEMALTHHFFTDMPS